MVIWINCLLYFQLIIINTIIKLCTIHSITNNNKQYKILKQFIQNLQIKIFNNDGVKCIIKYIEFMIECIQSHSQFCDIFYEINIIQEIINILSSIKIPKINLYINLSTNNLLENKNEINLNINNHQI